MQAAQAQDRIVELRSVEVLARAEKTQLVIRASRRLSLRAESLKSPDRLVLDLRNAKPRKGLTTRVSGGGGIQQVRIGRWRGSDVRIVVDLRRPMRSRRALSQLDDGTFVLSIDFAPAGTGDAQFAGARRSEAGSNSAAAAPNSRAASAVAPVASAIATAPTAQVIPHAPLAGRSLVIAVDAGHGGEDPGATGANGTREKNVVLEIARALARQIDAEPGMKAVLTRDGDYFVPLRERMMRARRKQADLFVSIHADSIRDRGVSGASVYTLSSRGASDEAARWLAERENAADFVGGVRLDAKNDVLASVLLDLSQTAALSASQTAAARVLRSLDRIGSIRKPRVQQAGFMVLKSPDIPSMLVETAYISNLAEERRLSDPAYQQKIAAAVSAGIREYFYSNPPPGTRMAQLVNQSRRSGG